MIHEKLFEVKGLKTQFKVGDKIAQAVNGVDFDIFKGEVLGIVGESGSGKSVTMLSLIQLIPNPPGEVIDGQVIFDGEQIFNGEELQKIKDIPKYKFFPKLDNEDKRQIASALFVVGWMILHLVLPIPGLLMFFISMILNFATMYFLFFTSPQRRPLAKFREKLYRRMRELRGRDIAMIFQEPMTSLNPVYTIGMQIIEAIYAKNIFDFLRDWIILNRKRDKQLILKSRAIFSAIGGGLSLLFYQLLTGWTFSLKSLIIGFAIGALLPLAYSLIVLILDGMIPSSYRKKSEKLFNEGVKLLDLVGIPDPAQRMMDYPHQFSGGMRQRAMIAMALAKNPALLIADEPTTALDVTIQAQILELMVEIKEKRKESAIVLITHDLAVVAETCERVIVMYGGMIQENAPTIGLFDNPYHPYTRGLLNSIPRPDKDKKIDRLDAIRGMVPNILNFPKGCKFCTRCDFELNICENTPPELRKVGKETENHFVRCHLYDPKFSKELAEFNKKSQT
ncbi:MAG: hypothetical protein B6244_08170 [Candidatus Cloacimonetes bacterium 4572_55]|nr:MAG: hypothetical protein B6244_08170 [Candidatus Cloacimonetes bacterium 4572_55]